MRRTNNLNTYYKYIVLNFEKKTSSFYFTENFFIFVYPRVQIESCCRVLYIFLNKLLYILFFLPAAAINNNRRSFRNLRKFVCFSILRPLRRRLRHRPFSSSRTASSTSEWEVHPRRGQGSFGTNEEAANPPRDYKRIKEKLLIIFVIVITH